MWQLAQVPATRASLLARLNDPRDQAAWEEFLAVYGPLVFADLRRRGFHHADCEDLTQRIFTRVFRGLRTFAYSPERGRFRDWLGTIVRHEAIRDYRDKSRRPAALTAPADLDAVADDAADPEWADAFQAHIYTVALERCRPRFEPSTWSAFEQVWVQDRPAAEAAANTGLTIDSVYVAKSRVLSAMARVIQELTDDLPLFSNGS